MNGWWKGRKGQRKKHGEKNEMVKEKWFGEGRLGDRKRGIGLKGRSGEEIGKKG